MEQSKQPKKKIVGKMIYFAEITRNSGVRGELLELSSQFEDELSVTVIGVETPEYVFIPELETKKAEFDEDMEEETMEQVELVFETGETKGERSEKKNFKIEVDSDHFNFPTQDKCPIRESITIHFKIGEDIESLNITLVIANIKEIPIFQGVMALDFGTSNTCYAYKEPFFDSDDSVQISPEIPSAIFYTQVSTKPRFKTGMEALQLMDEHPEAIYSYFLSIKRLLGVNREQPFFVADTNPQCQGEYFNEIDIASHIIKGFIEDHQKENQVKIRSFNATYPTLFSRPRKEALKKALIKGLRDANPEISISDSDVKLVMDEASAAAFGFIAQEIQSSIEQARTVQDDNRTILAFDFGGGTIDIAMIDASTRMTAEGKVEITQIVRGLSGDSYYGGDNVTLAVFKILKLRLANKIAEKLLRKQETEEAEELASTQKTQTSDDFMNAFFTDEDETDKSEDLSEEDKKRRDELIKSANVLINDTNPEIREVIELMISSNCKTLIDAFKRFHSENGANIVDENKLYEIAKKVEEAIEILVPTKYKVFELKNDPYMKRLAQQVFFELWREAENRKRDAVIKQHEVNIETPLHALKVYSTVDSPEFREVKVGYKEIERSVEEDIKQAVRRAKGLYDNVIRELKEEDPNYDPWKLYVVLAGNSSRIPLVQNLLKESFQNATDIVQAKNLKGVTAQGSCEQSSLPPFFKLISEDFSMKLPYSLGMWSRQLYIKFMHGFEVIFPRGTKPNQKVFLGENFAMIQDGIPGIKLYSYYHDEVTPTPIGLFDLKRPAGEVSQDEHDQCMQVIEDWKKLYPDWKEKFATDQDKDTPFGYILELQSDWALRLIDPTTTFYYELLLQDDVIPMERMPFNGLH
ncbi:MAG: hypothetical protein K8S87_12885 [Planctomycetes bacterium]|nr:hypothetical protein [Planctomycetota bacterium]